MALVIPDVGGGDIGGGDDGSDDDDCAPSLEGVGSFPEVDKWLGSSSYATQAGWQQLGAPLIQSSSASGCSMGCSVKEVVKKSELQKQINDRKAQLERGRIQREADLNHFEGDTKVSEFCSNDSDMSDAEAVQMEIDCTSEEDIP
ncbi:hypothetical protein ZWY2020_048669 [Hordeum vulgare]|nr:hypothetical protein ZWY2020_048669 [Hordeum vulgare]